MLSFTKKTFFSKNKTRKNIRARWKIITRASVDPAAFSFPARAFNLPRTRTQSIRGTREATSHSALLRLYDKLVNVSACLLLRTRHKDDEQSTSAEGMFGTTWSSAVHSMRFVGALACLVLSTLWMRGDEVAARTLRGLAQCSLLR